MESEKEINLKQIVHLLEMTFNAKNNLDRKSAEAELNKLDIRRFEVISILLTIMTATQVNCKIKKNCFKIEFI